MTTLSTSAQLVETLKASLETLQNGLSGRKVEIENAYKEAKTLADNTHKEAIKLAETTKKEALKQFESEEGEISKLENAIIALGGSSRKVKTTKVKSTSGEPKQTGFVVPTTLDEAKTQVQKVYFAISELGSAFKSDILEKANSYGEKLTPKNIDNLVYQLSGVLGVVVADGKDGKKSKYKVA